MRSRLAVAGLVLVSTVAACSGGNVFDLGVGTCFNDPSTDGDATEVSDVPVVECTEEHDNEVYALFDLDEGVFPGADAVLEQSGEGCFDRFEAYVGAAYEDSRYDISSYFPTSGSWDQGDREVICYVYDVDRAKLTGTAKDSAE